MKAEDLADRVREALGPWNDSDLPVTHLVARLVALAGNALEIVEPRVMRARVKRNQSEIEGYVLGASWADCADKIDELTGESERLLELTPLRPVYVSDKLLVARRR